MEIMKGERENPCNLPLQYLQDITNNFSEERELGRGSFGVVYKGVLRNGHMVAVKKLLFLPGMHDKHFENEVYHLTSLKHENIVRIVGYCYEIQHILIEHNKKIRFAEMPQRLLCLEFLPKGSLEKHISDGSRGLDWHKRYKILEGICRGLHHLHEEWQTGTPIIHLDLKPANILLNENMVPKIVDFGVSRLFDPEQTRAYTRTLVGSLGYMAPEYLNKGIITIKADIFSLGVIIIEIIAGHKNYPDGTGISVQDFVERVLKIWRTRFKELNHTSIEKDCEQIKRFIEMGLSCVETDASKRPTTREIIESLEGCGSSILHVSNGKRSATDKLDHNFWKEPDPTLDHRKVVQVSNILETQEVTEEGKPSPRDRLVVEILEQPERRDLILGEAFFAVEGDILRGRLIYLENRGNIQFSEYVVLLLFSERTAGVVTCK
ncbi:hypothetical protein HU200_064902 [Digitaria exilis]|uniref:Protein kinase domain-containing protein n=1 Tax=Digitaria exilis TaxID=1010633 RepID=A0A835A3K0_9POAL|nr:hypothetical protein HU200_064902 [Digitaria exilis]